MLSLLIANKTYSSWSLRPWLVLKHAGIPFQEQRVSFNAPDIGAQIRRVSPSGLVPALTDGTLVIWDSLAIVEYLAEGFPDRQLWPADRTARAVARSMCAEMHAGFATLRSALPMNLSARLPGRGWNLEVQREIDRIVAMWDDARARFGAAGRFLFGGFSIADAFFAPVVQRFVTYGIALPPGAAAYVEVITHLPAMLEWTEAARAENEFNPRSEPYRERP